MHEVAWYSPPLSHLLPSYRSLSLFMLFFPPNLYSPLWHGSLRLCIFRGPRILWHEYMKYRWAVLLFRCSSLPVFQYFAPSSPMFQSYIVSVFQCFQCSRLTVSNALVFYLTCVPVFQCPSIYVPPFPIFHSSRVPVFHYFHYSWVPVSNALAFQCSSVTIFQYVGLPLFMCSSIPVDQGSSVSIPMFQWSSAPVPQSFSVP